MPGGCFESSIGTIATPLSVRVCILAINMHKRAYSLPLVLIGSSNCLSTVSGIIASRKLGKYLRSYETIFSALSCGRKSMGCKEKINFFLCRKTKSGNSKNRILCWKKEISEKETTMIFSLLR